jgi:23S rRNA (uracil1939-C5)-methyltransferase
MSQPPSREYLIDSLSHDGRGVARAKGKVCFIAGALPGESVKAHITQQKSSHDQAVAVSIANPSEQRVAPPCPHIESCGGCQLQHLSHEGQLAYKQASVIDLVKRLANMAPISVLPPIASQPYHYRRRARLSVYTPNKGRPVVGFREANGHKIIPIDRCMVLVPALADLPNACQDLVARFTNPKIIGHIELSLVEQSNGSVPLVHLRTTEYPTADDFAWMAQWREQQDCRLSIEYGDKGYETLQPGDQVISLADGALKMHYRGGDFMQANEAVNEAIVRQVVKWMGDVDGDILDAFCGLGNFSLALAKAGHNVTGVEADIAMVERAEANASMANLQATFLCRDLFGDNKQLARRQFAAAVLDPPRDGANALIGELVKKKINKLVYVSCNPATMARDAAILQSAGYHLAELGIADMFPQTGHIEALALFIYSGKKK